MLERLRNQVASTTRSLFSHGPRPLQRTLDFAGDPGLLGPDSVSWRVVGDVAAFAGGIRALLVQTAHPEVVAGVEQHSSYRTDPLGRLTRTSFFVTATTFGAMPEVEEAVARVRAAHRTVQGRSERGRPYRAGDPALAAWVHNALTDSFLTAHLTYGGIELSDAEADRFVSEQTRVGALLDADPMPTTRADLTSWVADHPDIAPSPEMRDAVAFLANPPLDPPLRLGYRILRDAALATMPDRLLDILGLEKPIGAMVIGRTAVTALRWALGYSPTWRLALTRSGAPIPNGLFKQKARVS